MIEQVFSESQTRRPGMLRFLAAETRQEASAPDQLLFRSLPKSNSSQVLAHWPSEVVGTLLLAQAQPPWESVSKATTCELEAGTVKVKATFLAKKPSIKPLGPILLKQTHSLSSSWSFLKV